MDAVTITAVASIAVGLTAAGAAVYGHRGQQRVNHSGVVLTGYGGLVGDLQEERADLRQKLAANEALLAAARLDLERERADRTVLQTQINDLTAENARLHERLDALGGDAQ
ncbi:hypothetical protein [Streptomyces niveus]|uniref:hypothetical protein n=1 Tax=Streptomyces niveus TaxID=193462 RepID=UPI0003C59DA5|nr:hypothetical protein [Streptomyces niveus]EST22760.1 hypothetical protein M877_28690 [Streptomyces niveus NCIMB 11891]